MDQLLLCLQLKNSRTESRFALGRKEEFMVHFLRSHVPQQSVKKQIPSGPLYWPFTEILAGPLH